MVQIENIAFDPPGGEGNEVSSSRPINLSHLDRQTLGDRDLEQEILKMFCHQSAELAEQLEKSGGEERTRIAHKLKGAARAVGAFQVADAAAEIEANPKNQDGLKKLLRCIEEAQDFICSICR
jgi:HPt (histidine-containing phosphotransfer) domain-containing protein